MAWSKKGTHKIVVDGQTYLWHRNEDWIYRNTWIVVKKVGTEGQLVFFDPHHHDLPIGPRSVRMAIEFGSRCRLDAGNKKGADAFAL